MSFRGFTFSIAFIGALLLAAPGDDGMLLLPQAEARAGKSNRRVASKRRASRSAKAKAKAKAKRARARRSCRVVHGKRRCKGGGKVFAGRGVKKELLRTEPVPKPSGEIWLYASNFREEIKVNIYDQDGSIDEEALAQLDQGFRCKRTGEARAVDPRLFETLSAIYDHFGRKRIELVSGFRFQRNEGSRHFHAAAMDIRIEGVSIRELYEFAESLDTGGMGIGLYPRSGFVHVDWRAPGDGSYRWTDYSPPDGNARDKAPSAKSKKPQS